MMLPSRHLMGTLHAMKPNARIVEMSRDMRRQRVRRYEHERDARCPVSNDDSVYRHDAAAADIVDTPRRR